MKLNSKMRGLISACLFISCQQKENRQLRAHICKANEALMEQVDYWMTNIHVHAMENPGKMEEFRNDGRFYYGNTTALMDFSDRSDDSLRFWRLTETEESRKRGFHSDLHREVVLGEDTLVAKIHLIQNLHSYVKGILQSYSYCVSFNGLGVVGTHHSADSTVIRLYGTIDENISNYYLELSDSTADWQLTPSLGKIVLPYKLEDSLSGELVIIPKLGAEIRCLPFSVKPKHFQNPF